MYSRFLFTGVFSGMFRHRRLYSSSGRFVTTGILSPRMFCCYGHFSYQTFSLSGRFGTDILSPYLLSPNILSSYLLSPNILSVNPMYINCQSRQQQRLFVSMLNLQLPLINVYMTREDKNSCYLCPTRTCSCRRCTQSPSCCWLWGPQSPAPHYWL